MLNIKEIFLTLQGEGYHSGSPAVFIRLGGCNLRCSFCDTDFLTDIRELSEMVIVTTATQVGKGCKFAVITGGEPGMQDITDLCKCLQQFGWYVAVETNGMFVIPQLHINWITFSPKNVKWSAIKLLRYNEIKFVVEPGSAVPLLIHAPDPEAKEYMFPSPDPSRVYISPINPTHDDEIGTRTASELSRINLTYATNLVMNSGGKYKLNVQLHKYIGVQ